MSATPRDAARARRPVFPSSCAPGSASCSRSTTAWAWATRRSSDRATSRGQREHRRPLVRRATGRRTSRACCARASSTRSASTLRLVPTFDCGVKAGRGLGGGTLDPAWTRAPNGSDADIEIVLPVYRHLAVFRRADAGDFESLAERIVPVSRRGMSAGARRCDRDPRAVCRRCPDDPGAQPSHSLRARLAARRRRRRAAGKQRLERATRDELRARRSRRRGPDGRLCRASGRASTRASNAARRASARFSAIRLRRDRGRRRLVPAAQHRAHASDHRRHRHARRAERPGAADAGRLGAGRRDPKGATKRSCACSSAASSANRCIASSVQTALGPLTQVMRGVQDKVRAERRVRSPFTATVSQRGRARSDDGSAFRRATRVRGPLARSRTPPAAALRSWSRRHRGSRTSAALCRARRHQDPIGGAIGAPTAALIAE